jgi:hypothetical protein
MIAILWTAAGLALLYFWLTGHWFAWLIMGAILAFTVQLWCGVFGLETVPPESSQLYGRVIFVFICAGIPFYLRAYLRRGMDEDWPRPRGASGTRRIN